MSQHLTTFIVAAKTLTLLLGGSITYLAYRAYQRTDAGPLGALTAGFGMVTIGSLLAGIMDRLLDLDPGYALVTESMLTAVGFAIILYSLYAR